MYYKGDIVRLVADDPVHGLPKHAEGTIIDIRRDPEGYPEAAEVQFISSGKTVTAELAFDALEPVVGGSLGCTAVLWHLAESTRTLVSDGIAAILELERHGFAFRAGLNLMQLVYDQQDRFWRRGNRLSVGSNEEAQQAAGEWHGCTVAFSGRQRFELEFRISGRRAPYVLLHQRWETYWEQRRTTHPAMTLLGVLGSLYYALDAQCCAIPVASNWLMDEDFDSLLQQPYFPDLFLIHESKLPPQLPRLFRTQRLTKGRAILTTLPVKFSPTDDSIERTERELKLNQLRACQAIGEKAYDQLYETHGSTTGLYSDAKEAFYDAIRIANELGLTDEAAELYKRLEHIKAVFRSQFS